MGITWIKYPVMFVTVVLIQVLLLNQIQFSGFVNPYLYLLFILLLPVSMARYQVLLLSFLLGLTIDVFSNTPGIHAAATVFAGFLRSPLIGRLSGRESEINDYPGLKQNGMRWFVLYTAVMVILHHFFLFYVEVFTLSRFFATFFRSLASSVFTIFMIVLSQFLIFRD
ncbi:MAG TPA: rod shape-determining protein MreD [Prolixibacteraceae bacterium]|nr:rod shape-determining protein MreD [Prolixibacteraceae bacterium]